VSAGLRFEVVTSPQAFDALRPEWNSLLPRCPTSTLFNTWEWLRLWWEHYGTGRRLAIVVARDGADTRAIFPLHVERERWKGIIPFQTLRLLGDGTSDSDYLDFLIPRGEAVPLVEAFWKFLLRDSGLEFDLIRVCEMPMVSPHYTALKSLLDRDGAAVREQRIGAVFTRLPDGWEPFLASLKPRMRTKVRSLRRRLEESHRVRFLCAENAGDIDRALPSLFDLHGRRWASRDQSGVFSSPKRAFYRDMSHRFGELGWLRLYTLEVDGSQVAHQYCVAHERTLYLLQEGYDPLWEVHGVGNLLRALVFEAAIQEQIRVYDFLGGVTQHKLSWAGEIKESTRFTCRGRGQWGGLYFGLSGLSTALTRLRRAS